MEEAQQEVENRWEKQESGLLGGGGNYILRPIKDKGLYAISYQPSQQLSGGLFSHPMFNCETSQGETAICDYRDKRYHYWILNGDFRKEYEALINQGIEACLEFYKSKKKEFGSSWTTGTFEEEEEDDDD